MKSTRLTYIGGDTPLHKVDARVKLVALLAFSVASLAVGSWPGLAVLAVCVLTACAVGRISLTRLNGMLVPVYVMGAFSVLFNVMAQPNLAGFAAGAYLLVRMSVLVAGSFVVCLSTPSSELLDAFAWFLAPLRHLRVPVDDIAFTLALSIRFIPVIEAELGRIRAAQFARGAGAAHSPVREARIWAGAFSALFVGLFRHADTLASAMDARCYGAASARTKLPRG